MRAAHELGATQAKKQVVLGSGADWIKTQADLYFPEALACARLGSSVAGDSEGYSSSAPRQKCCSTGLAQAAV
jgi:hypothetical protein